jgi:triosephosphate isomerase
MQKNKKLLIAANWKMTPPTISEARKNAFSFKAIAKKYQKAPKAKASLQVLVCPPYPFAIDIREIFKNSPASVGAQDVSQHDGGSKTGEVASTMLQSIGVSHVVVGHSERRAAGDTDDSIALKLGQVIRTKMQAILCVGEDARDENGEYLEVVKAQLKAGLSRLSNADFSRVIIAYEPVWAVGRPDNEALSGHDLHQMVIYIRKMLRDLYNDSIATATKILYGGSVTPENAEDIIWNGEVDGLLIGRASFDPVTYEAICKNIALPTHASMIVREATIKKMKIISKNKARPSVDKSREKVVKGMKRVKKNKGSSRKRKSAKRSAGKSTRNRAR